MIVISHKMTVSEPRVLIVSHNALHPQQNMGRTLLNLFSTWSPENLAQLYIRDEQPVANEATKFYRVTDFDAAKSLFGGSHGGPVKASAEDGETHGISAVHQAAYTTGRQKKAYQYILRNAIWHVGRWCTPQLHSWLNEFSPDVIFLACGGYSFIYDIAEQIGNDLRIPVVPYFCDDFYMQNRPDWSILYPMVHRGIRSRIEKTVCEAKIYICISAPMEQKYFETFGKRGSVIMTGATGALQEPAPLREGFSQDDPFVLGYFGRLGLNRNKALLNLGTWIKHEKLPMVIHVYTTETDPGILSEMTLDNGIELMGAIPGEAVLGAMRSCDAVLHIESDDPASVERTRYSMSTKIADMLASGVCSLAYGPAEIASIQYLRDEGLALVISGEAQMVSVLNSLLDASVRKACVERALVAARDNHDAMANSLKLKTVLAEVAAR